MDEEEDDPKSPERVWNLPPSAQLRHSPEKCAHHDPGRVQQQRVESVVAMKSLAPEYFRSSSLHVEGENEARSTIRNGQSTLGQLDRLRLHKLVHFAGVGNGSFTLTEIGTLQCGICEDVTNS